MDLRLSRYMSFLEIIVPSSTSDSNALSRDDKSFSGGRTNIQEVPPPHHHDRHEYRYLVDISLPGVLR